MKTWKPAPYGMRDNPGVFDTGNGAIKTIEERDAHPGVERAEGDQRIVKVADEN